MPRKTIRPSTGHTLGQFEAKHGQPKLQRMTRELEIARAKVEQIARKHAVVHVRKVKDNTVRFALMGDLHYGSLQHSPENVEAFVKYAARNGFKRVLVTGDVLDGWRMYRGQEFELRDVGFEAQLKRFVSDAPRVRGVSVEFITGNHDASFTSSIGVDVGRALADKRHDWGYLGQDYAVVRFLTPAGAYDVGLMHPSGGTAYALSYRPQKIIEQLEGGTKPNMICIGHFHKAEFLPSYRNLVAIQTGTFQWQTPYMQRKGLSAHVGGWLVEVAVGEIWNVVKAEFVAFYR